MAKGKNLPLLGLGIRFTYCVLLLVMEPMCMLL